ncbi:MAG: phenylalanine--tRNA ligase subunit alpha [Nanobdellota archaeon]
MSQVKELITKLHPLERKVAPSLKDGLTAKDLEEKTGLKDVEVMRALQWLENKDVLKINTETRETVELGENGKRYLEEGLPEIRYLNIIKDSPKSMKDIIKEGLDGQEAGACTGILKKKAAIEMKDKEVQITDNGKKLLEKEPIELMFMKKLPMELKSIKDEDKLAFDNLKKRKDVISTEKRKIKRITLTEKGKELAKADLSEIKVADSLSHEMLKEGTWKDKEFRKYDIRINVPSINGGKKHFVNQAVDYIKKVWLELGFEEMEGNLVQTSFWDLDCLFVPQDHPARQMQDTFYIKNPEKGKLPEWYEKIKEVHETGGDTGSTGWKGKWSPEKAKENMLRTHTTVLSAKEISQLKKEDLPKKYFSVGKVFRNEELDWKHLFEFYQVEGIVVDPDANMSHLKGYLKDFYKKMGYSDVRMRPAHFPYTEPSVEVEVYHPKKEQWVELGGAGIFRPEVVKPLLGFECPVLAWGQGMGRIIAEYWNITDIRDLYKNDLKQLREIRYWMR